MATKRQPAILERDLGERYTISLSEFQNNLYLHLKDSLGKPQAKRVTLHMDAILKLNAVLPEFVKRAEDRKRKLQSEEREDSPAKRSKDGSQ